MGIQNVVYSPNTQEIKFKLSLKEWVDFIKLGGNKNLTSDLRKSVYECRN